MVLRNVESQLNCITNMNNLLNNRRSPWSITPSDKAIKSKPTQHQINLYRRGDAAINKRDQNIQNQLQ